MTKDYSDWEDALDLHASSRDKKRERREIDRRMRGNRSVFVMRDAQEKRDARTIRGKENI